MADVESASERARRGVVRADLTGDSVYREIKRKEHDLIPNYESHALSHHPGWVYFVGNDDESIIKIGHTKKPSVAFRIDTHRKSGAFGQGLHFLAAVKGTRDDEQAVHAYFREELIDDGRTQTENFRASERLIDYVVWLRDVYYTIIDEEESDVPAFPFSAWRPTDQNRKPTRRDPDLLTGLKHWGFLPERVLTQDDYWTDKELVEKARAVLGGQIDLDPASAWFPNSQVVKARRFYSITENGLLQPWFGNIWLNPPFSEWKAWAEKIVMELEINQSITGMVVLANSRTITARYFEPVLRKALAIAVLSGRWSFWGTDKDGSPSNGTVMLLMSGDEAAFSKHFGSIGVVFETCAIRHARYKATPAS